MNWDIPEEIEMGVGGRGKDKLILLVFHKKPQIFRFDTLHLEIQEKSPEIYGFVTLQGLI